MDGLGHHWSRGIAWLTVFLFIVCRTPAKQITAQRRGGQDAGDAFSAATVAVGIAPPYECLGERRRESALNCLSDRGRCRLAVYHVRCSQAPFLPSYWLSSGVLLWSEGAFQSAFFFLLVLLSYVLFFGLLICTRMGRVFFDGASAVQSRGTWMGNWARWRSRAAFRQTSPLCPRGQSQA